MKIEDTISFVSDPQIIEGLQQIYDHIICREDMRLKFVLYSEFGLPALCACVREIESFCEKNPDYHLNLNDSDNKDHIKRCIGRLVREEMINTLGYVVASRGNRIPGAVQSKYFSTAACYRREGTALRVTLRCGTEEPLTLEQSFPENVAIGI